jgi:hypothetical protein
MSGAAHFAHVTYFLITADLCAAYSQINAYLPVVSTGGAVPSKVPAMPAIAHKASVGKAAEAVTADRSRRLSKDSNSKADAG